MLAPIGVCENADVMREYSRKCDARREKNESHSHYKKSRVYMYTRYKSGGLSFNS